MALRALSLCLICLSAFSQEAEYQVRYAPTTKFAPTANTTCFLTLITNMFVEMLADSPLSLTNTSDGSVVNTWSNLVSVSGFEQASHGATSPHYRKTGGPNGVPAVDFQNGGGATLTTLTYANGFNSNQPITIFIVAANPISAVNSSVQTLFSNGSLDPQANIDNFAGSTFQVGSSPITPIPAMAYTNWVLYTFVFSNASSYARINGHLVSSGNVGSGNFGGNGPLKLGNDPGNATQNVGLMTAFLAYRANPDTNSLQSSENCLMARYGINASGFDEVTNWSMQVFLNSGAFPSTTTLSGLQTYYNGAIADGFEESLLAVSLCATDNLATALTPFLNRKGITNLWENHNFVAGDLTVNGIKANGTTKYVDTKLNPSTQLTANNTGITLYLQTAGTTSGPLDFGAQDATPNTFNLFPDDAGTTYCDMYNFTVGQGRATVSTSGAGFYSGERTAANSLVIYYAKSTSAHASIASIATSGGAPVNLNAFVFNLNLSGSPLSTGWSDSRISYIAVTLGLSSSLDSSHFNRVQALRTTYGGGFQ